MSFPLPLPTTQLLATIVASWGLWALARRLSKKDHLARIRGPQCASWIKGHFGDLISPRGWDFHTHIADEYGGVAKIKMFFGEDALYVYDPKALQHIIVKEQDVYEESDNFIFGNEVAFGKGLLSTLGDPHRKQRKMLNPVFSTAHMRDMIPTFYEVVDKLAVTFERMTAGGPRTIDALSWMARVALELVGQSGLGYSFDTLEEHNIQHPYRESMKNFIPAVQKLNIFRFVFLSSVSRLGPSWLRRAAVDFISLFYANFRRLRDIIDVMHNTSVQILESKKELLRRGDAAAAEQIGRGKDIISILVKANALAPEQDRLPDDEVLAQISTLTFAAMDTTSSAMTRILHLLSEHPDVQQKLRDEFLEARERLGNELSYDDISNLPYLDAICRETLRLYPSVIMVSRTCRKDSILPLATPITTTDGTKIHEVFVPKGTRVFVSNISSNRNPALWGPDVFEWKPERWLSPLPDALTSAKIPGVYSHLMTFLGGGRACIGFKFSQLEMKVVLFVLLSKFEFSRGIDKEVLWQMGGVTTPVFAAGDGYTEAQLPLSIKRVDVNRA